MSTDDNLSWAGLLILLIAVVLLHGCGPDKEMIALDAKEQADLREMPTRKDTILLQASYQAQRQGIYARRQARAASAASAAAIGVSIGASAGAGGRR